jgi:hypothetical protein
MLLDRGADPKPGTDAPEPSVFAVMSGRMDIVTKLSK